MGIQLFYISEKCLFMEGLIQSVLFKKIDSVSMKLDVKNNLY